MAGFPSQMRQPDHELSIASRRGSSPPWQENGSPEQLKLPDCRAVCCVGDVEPHSLGPNGLEPGHELGGEVFASAACDPLVVPPIFNRIASHAMKFRVRLFDDRTPEGLRLTQINFQPG